MQVADVVLNNGLEGSVIFTNLRGSKKIRIEFLTAYGLSYSLYADKTTNAVTEESRAFFTLPRKIGRHWLRLRALAAAISSLADITPSGSNYVKQKVRYATPGKD